MDMEMLSLLRIIPIKYLVSGIGVISLLMALFVAVNNHCDKRAELTQIAELRKENELLKKQYAKAERLKKDVQKQIQSPDDIVHADIIAVLECLQDHRDGKPCKARNTNGTSDSAGIE